MDCPGEYLKRERELRDISLDEISKEIKVPVKLLRALEADDYPSMPHTAFVKGFIRAYCKHLGVDENDALLRYELYLQEVAEFEKPAPKPKQMEVGERSFPVRRLLTLSLVALGVIIIFGIYFFTSSPEDLEKSIVPAEVAKAIPGDKDKEVEEELAQKEESKKEPKLAAIDEKPFETVKKAKAKIIEPALNKPVISPKPVMRVAPAPLKTGPGEHLLRVYATELAWMKVTIDSDEPFEVLLKPLETVQWKGKVFFCS
ncbi:MAG: helix-turn-helix domain-containing protein [Thermodesulfobacteriota bacterium]